MLEVSVRHMLRHLFLKRKNVFPKVPLANTILLVNAFAWYSCVPVVLNEIMEVVAFTSNETLMLYTISFCGAVISILLGAFLVGWFGRRNLFLLCWTLSGFVCSTIPILPSVMTVMNALIVSLLFSVSFGFGLTAAMASFADSTVPENRARSGAIVLLSMFLGTVILRSTMTANIFMDSLILACWRALSLIAFVFISLKKVNIDIVTEPSLISILKERSFVLYLIPWTVFSLVNYLAWPINAKVYGEELINISALTESIIAGAFAIVAGLVSDVMGRKRVILAGFILFGLGYAVIGIYPSNIISWYFYMVVDGVAWGIISVIFLLTLWGDLAHNKPSEKYYAIGILPYSLSSFMRLTVGSFIVERISPYAIFSFAAFFLFLAVLPLMYAPETLPEKKIRERELKQYVEKAKKIKEKYT